MSKSVLSVILYNGNKSGDSQEESTSKCLVNLVKSSSMKLNFLYDLSNTNVTSAYGIPEKVLSHLQKCYSHISLKLWPYLNQKSPRNLRIHYKLNKYPCKDYFRIFTKSYNFKKHTRNIPIQRKIEYIKQSLRNDYLNNKLRKKIVVLDSRASNKVETNSKMTSCYNNVSQSNIHSHCIYTFDKMHNYPVTNADFSKIKMQEILPLDNVANLLQNLNLNQPRRENNTNINIQSIPTTEELSHNFLIERVDKNSKSSSYNPINTNYSNAPYKIDFYSGDNSRSEHSNLKYIIDDISDTKELIQLQSKDVSSKTRSVQWSTEVNVIYYTGDVSGGKKLWREVEPLHEEVCLQKWHNNLVQLNLTNKNVCTMNDYQYFDS